MSDTRDHSVAPSRGKESLPWFTFHVASFHVQPGIQVAMRDDSVAAALLWFLTASWQRGPLSTDELERTCGPGAKKLAESVLTETPSGWVCPWLEERRTEQDAYRAERAASGRKGGLAKASTAKAPPSTALADPSQYSTVQNRTEQDSTGQDSTAQGSNPPAAGAADEEKPKEGGNEITRWWDREFKRIHGYDYVWVRTGKKNKGCPDAIALSKLMGQGRPHDEIMERITNFLERGVESGNQWEVENANPRTFAMKYGTLGARVRKLTQSQKNMAEIERQVREMDARDPDAPHPLFPHTYPGRKP